MPRIEPMLTMQRIYHGSLIIAQAVCSSGYELGMAAYSWLRCKLIKVVLAVVIKKSLSRIGTSPKVSCEQSLEVLLGYYEDGNWVIADTSDNVRPFQPSIGLERQPPPRQKSPWITINATFSLHRVR